MRVAWSRAIVLLGMGVTGLALAGCGSGSTGTGMTSPDLTASQSGVIELTADSFRTMVLEGRGVALVEFYMPTCSHCRAMAPIVEQVAAAYSGRALVARIDVGSVPEVAQQQDVAYIPTFVTYKNGAAQNRFVGETARGTLTGLLDASLATP